MRRSLLLLPAVGLAIAGCDVSDDGPPTTQTRDVASFTKIDSEGSVVLHLRVGEPQRISVRAGENVIDDVHTDVDDGTLKVSFDHSGFDGSRGVTIDATVPALTGIKTSGSADIDAGGVETDAFELHSS